MTIQAGGHKYMAVHLQTRSSPPITDDSIAAPPANSGTAGEVAGNGNLPPQLQQVLEGWGYQSDSLAIVTYQEAIPVSFITDLTQWSTQTLVGRLYIKPDELGKISIRGFHDVILSKNYPTSYTFGFTIDVPFINNSLEVKARILEQCQHLGWHDGRRLLYQQTPEVAGGILKPRAYVTGVRETPGLTTETHAEFDWLTLDNYDARAHRFTFPAPEKFPTIPEDFIWVPSVGKWVIDLNPEAPYIEYHITADPGGRFPFNPFPVAMAYPTKFLQDVLGLTGEFEKYNPSG